MINNNKKRCWISLMGKLKWVEFKASRRFPICGVKVTRGEFKAFKSCSSSDGNKWVGFIQSISKTDQYLKHREVSSCYFRNSP